MKQQQQLFLLNRFINKAWSKNARQSANDIIRQLESEIPEPYRRNILLNWNIVKIDTVYPSQQNLISLKSAVDDYINYLNHN